MWYLAARSVDEALEALANSADMATPSRPRLVAGGTDLYPALGDRPMRHALIDLSKIPELQSIEAAADGWRIGAACRWSSLIKTPLPPCFDGLKAAAREVGSVQIQNAGTVAGNLCNASPAADGVPPLLTLDATVELRSVRGMRRLPLTEFLIGVRQTALAPDEIMTAVHIPHRPSTARSAFLKLGARRYLVISICMVAVMIEPDDQGNVAAAHVSVGACSEVAKRLPELERRLRGAPMDGPVLAALVDDQACAPLFPITDIRAAAAYRMEGARELVRRALTTAAGG